MSWGGLHPRLYCRGRFAGFWPSPVIRCHLIRVTVQKLPGGRKPPAPCGCGGPARACQTWNCAGGPTCTGFDIEHACRFAKHSLGWDKAALRYPGQVQRWTWIIIAALTMLRLARPAAEDHRQRWERRRARGRLTPGRVRRDFCRLAALAGTPARPPKTPRPAPDALKAAPAPPATRYPVITKAA